MRLDRLLSELGCGSRKEASSLLRRGRVAVDGVVVRDAAAHVDPASATVTLDGSVLRWRAAHHRLLNKPADTITSTSEREGASVVSLLPASERHRDWMPVGRLDKDTEGLLLLTTDGELAHRLTHPRFKVDKVYEAELERDATEHDVTAFRAGIELGGVPLLPAELSFAGSARIVRIVIREGKYHQVKRMFASRGNRVVALRRIAFGPLALPDDLGPGQSRELTDHECLQLYAAVGLTPPG